MGAGNEVAGLATDYASGRRPGGRRDHPASLTITANNDAKIVTQSDAPGYNGASYSGFVHGQDPSVLTGTPAITRSNAGTESAGTYAGVLVPSGLSSTNYTISYVNGNYQILPAQQLLVKIANVTSAYGTSPGYTITSAEYLDGSGSSLHSLTQTAQSGNRYTYSDGLGRVRNIHRHSARGCHQWRRLSCSRRTTRCRAPIPRSVAVTSSASRSSVMKR